MSKGLKWKLPRNRRIPRGFGSFAMAAALAKPVRKRAISMTIAELQKAHLRQLVGEALERQKAQKDNSDYAHPLESEE